MAPGFSIWPEGPQAPACFLRLLTREGSLKGGDYTTELSRLLREVPDGGSHGFLWFQNPTNTWTRTLSDGVC